ncbi:MAG: CDP-diacylglycerol--glycerol-3-phosphate 3-phosphatidyltransferase [Patescibacteria group bacterium]
MYKQIPNAITVARLVLAVPLLILLFLPTPSAKVHALTVGLAIFCAVSDKLDGSLARLFHCESDFGKQLDPWADKVLVLSFIPLWYHGMIHPVPLVIIFLRDAFSEGLRRWYPNQVIAAKLSGKIKTVTNLVFLCLLVGALPVPDGYFHWFSQFKTPLYYSAGWIISIVCIWSGVDYYRRIVLAGER